MLAVLYRLAQQTALFYQDLKSKLQSPSMARLFNALWSDHLLAKAAYYEAEAQSEAAKALRAEHRIPEELSRLRVISSS